MGYKLSKTKEYKQPITPPKQIKGIQFDPKLHKYTIDNIELESVTTWIGNYFCTPFTENNGHIWKSQSKAKKNLQLGEGITNAEDLRHYWTLYGERAAANGTACHTYVQLYDMALKYDTDIEPKTGYEQAIRSAFDKIRLTCDIIALERQVYSLAYRLAGSVDCIFRVKATGEYGILDWKTIDDIHKEKDKFKNELSKYKETPLLKAAIQLNTYNVLGDINAPNSNLYVVQLKSTGEYEVFGGGGKPLIDVSKEVRLALCNKEDKLQAILNLI